MTFCTKIRGKAKLYHADCLHILPIIIGLKRRFPDQKIHVICDPPYEDELHASFSRNNARNKSGSLNALDFVGVNEQRADFAAMMVEASSGWLLAFSLAEGVRAWRDVIQDAGGKWDTTVAWVKPDSAPRFNGQGPSRGFECVCAAWCGTGHRSWNGGGRRGVFTHNVNTPNRVSAKDGGHPTEKPLALMMDLVSLYTDVGDVVVDPFMGSGTTGEACIRLGRAFVGIEKDEKYYRMAVQRLTDCDNQHDFLRPILRPKQLNLIEKENKNVEPIL